MSLPREPVAVQIENDRETSNGYVTGPPKWSSLFTFTTLTQVPLLAAATAFAILSGLVPPALAVILGRIFDSFTSFGGVQLEEHHYKEDITRYCIALIVLAAVSWLFNAAFFMLWRTFGDFQARTSRDKIFKEFLSKRIAWYDLRGNGISVLLSTSQSQIHELHAATSQSLGFVIQYIATTITALGLALFLSWDLTLVTLAALPISALILWFMSRHMQPHVAAQQEQRSLASKHAINAFTNIDTVKCFNGQSQETHIFKIAVRNAAKHYRKQARINATQIGFVRFMILLMFVQGFWYGSHLVITGKKSAGIVVTTFWACLQATQTLEQIFPQVLVLEKGRAAGQKLGMMIYSPKETGSKSIERLGSITPKTCSGDIEFRSVFFSYPTRPKQPVLIDVNIFFAAGETTFIVGASGSGKSTLGQLMMKLYDPGRGNIILDGVDICDIDYIWLRSNVTLVEQQSSLFQDTISSNISLAHRHPARLGIQDVKEAIQFAMLQETINNMPEGLNTSVGTKGAALSGGQRQRVELARARLRDTPILILDESTSALDHVSRSLVMSAVRHWRRHKTTIIISHDMSQISGDDFVYVMKDGQVIQEGFASSLWADIESVLYKSPPKEQACGYELNHHPDNPSDEVEKTELSLSQILWSAPSCTSTLVATELPIYPVLTEIGMAYLPPASDRSNHDFREYCSDDGSFVSYPSGTPSLPPLSPTSPGMLSPDTGYSKHFSTQRPLLRTLSSNDIELLERKGRTASLKRCDTAASRKDLLLRLENQETRDRPSIQNLPDKTSSSPSLTVVFKSIWPVLDFRNKLVLLLGFGGAFGNAVATPLFAWVFSNLLATFYLPGDQSQQAFKWAISILGVAFFDAMASFIKHYALECCGQAWVDALRIEAMKRILDQPKQFFTEKENSPSSMAQSLDRDAEETRNLLGRFAAYGFVAVTMMAVAVVWSLIVCWELALVALACSPVVYIITRSYDAVNSRAETKVNEDIERASVIMNETFTSIKTVRIFTLESHFQHKHDKAVSEIFKSSLWRAFKSSLFFGVSDSVILLVEALLFYYGASLTWTHKTSVQDILMVFSLLLFTLASASTIVSFIPQIGTSKATSHRLLRLSNLPEDSHEHQGTTRITSIGEIALKRLSFTYRSRPDERILDRISLKFPKGSVTAIVGSSGSGKSTIASLLVRLYPTLQNDAHHISVDRRDIAHIHTPTLRNLISIVPQTAAIFPLTVAANISYGLPVDSPHNTTASLRAAAEAAGIDEFIMSLPLGYNTLIGDGGTTLSGGQAQRVCISRALIRQPRFLVVDEPTSALDPRAAALVRNTIQRLARETNGLSILIITHDKSMMEIAERIVVLERGQVVQEGSYAELRARRGPFANLLSGGRYMGKAE